MKKALALLLAFCMVIALAACGGAAPAASSEEAAPASSEAAAPASSEEAAPASSEEAAPAGDEEEVTLYVYIAGMDAPNAVHTILERFMEQNPGITVELMDSQDGYFSTILATGDVPDLLNQPATEVLHAMVEDGLYADISDTEAAKYVPDYYRETSTWDGKFFGIPQGAAFAAMYYNMDILEKAGVTELPQNFDEFIDVCQKVTDAGYEALTLPAAAETISYMLFECIMANEAGDDLGPGGIEEEFKNGTFDFSKYPGIVEKLEKLVPYIAPGSTGQLDDDVQARMSSGDCAMLLGGNWMATVYLNSIKESSGEGKAAMGLPPFNDAGKDLWISVSPESIIGMAGTDASEAHLAARKALFEFFWAPEQYSLYQAERGCIPINTNLPLEALELPDEVKAVLPAQAAANGVLMGFNITTAEFRATSCAVLNDAYSGNKPVQDAINELAALLPTSFFADGNS